MRKIIHSLMLFFTISGFSQDGTLDFSFNQPMGAKNGDVITAAVQPDGKVMVGGDFTSLNNISYNKLARIHSDGTIDATFNTGSGFDNTVTAIGIYPGGKIIAAGNFTSYNGISKNRIVRLNSDGSIDNSFNIGTGANDIVFAVAVQTDGKIVVAGRFSVFNGRSNNKVIRLNADGTIDLSFNVASGANSTINTCVIQSDGKILLGGSFNSFSGAARSRIARLNPDGSLDAGFTSAAIINDNIETVSLQPDGKIIIGGNFTSYSGKAVNFIARLNADSTLDSSFAIGSGFDYGVKSIAVQTDGKILAGGNFYKYNGTDCSHIARLNPDGSIDAAFSSGTNSGTDAAVFTVAVQSNGKILIGGTFSRCNTFLRNKLASLNTTGSTDTGFYPFLENLSSQKGDVSDVAVQADGKIIIGGSFSSYRGIPSQNLARLNADGTSDILFKMGTGADAIVKKIAVTSNDKIIIAGDFKTYNGTAANGIAQLNADGTLDTSFNAGGVGLNGNVNTLSLQSDGKIIIGGDFSTVNGLSRNKLARLNANGTVDASFTTALDRPGSIWTSVVQPDGKVIIGGLGLVFNGISVGQVARLNANGSLDVAFNSGAAGANYFVYSSAVQSDGKIILTGSFSTFNKIPSKGVVRLNADGSPDTSFTVPEIGANATVYSSTVQRDGKIIVGGTFSYYTNTTGWNIMRLNTDGTLDAAFNAGNGFNAYVSALALQNDGKILAAGNFTSYNKNNIQYIARLHNAANLSTDYFNHGIKIVIYPNPAVDYIRFSLPDGINISGFEVFDMAGRKIESNSLYADFIDVRKYSKGVYFLGLKTDIGFLKYKFIKQ